MQKYVENMFKKFEHLTIKINVWIEPEKRLRYTWLEESRDDDLNE